MQSIECMSPKRLQRSTESYGLGQSGYTAGRTVEDPALNLVGRNISYPRGTDDHVLADGDDERWTGAGGEPWVPEEVAHSELPPETEPESPAPGQP